MKILIMRPSDEGKKLMHKLKKIGIFSCHFFFFSFYPSTSSISLSKRINELYNSDIVLLFSKKSVHYTNLYLKKNHLKWPSQAQYFTIGKSTASFLYKFVKKKLFFLKYKKIVKIY